MDERTVKLLKRIEKHYIESQAAMAVNDFFCVQCLLMLIHETVKEALNELNRGNRA